MMAGALRELAADLCAPPALRACFDGDRRPGRGSAGGAWLSWDCSACWHRRGRGGMGLADADFVLLAEEAGSCGVARAARGAGGTGGAALPSWRPKPVAAACCPHWRAARRASRSPTRRIRYASVAAGRSRTGYLCTPEAVTLARPTRSRRSRAPSVDAGRRLLRAAHCGRRGPAVAGGGGCGAHGHERLLNRGARVHGRAVPRSRRAHARAGSRRTPRSACSSASRSAPYQARQASPGERGGEARVRPRGGLCRGAHGSGPADARALAAVSHAKLAATEAADLAARTAIQVHGAMGYSWEVDLHFYMKHAWALAGAWGDRSFHARRMQALVCGGALSPWARIRHSQRTA